VPSIPHELKDMPAPDAEISLRRGMNAYRTNRQSGPEQERAEQ
jgi:hypothetical protein